MDFTNPTSDLAFNDSVRLFPNPANDQISISIGTNFENANFRIYSMLGIEVLNGKISDEQSIELNGFELGIYSLELIIDDLRVSKLFIKN